MTSVDDSLQLPGGSGSLTKIIVSPLTHDVDGLSLCTYFSPFGRIMSVHITLDNKGVERGTLLITDVTTELISLHGRQILINGCEPEYYFN
jgi:hypothetical protein